MTFTEAMDAPVAAGHGVMIIPKWDEGDIRVEWDQDKKGDVEAAREQFNNLKKKGYTAYRLDPKSADRGEVLREFDPKAEKIIMVAPMAGG